MSTLKIEERIVVEAPVERVWKFLLDPARVAACLPGAQFDGVDGGNTFLGRMKVKVGPVMTEFKGRATMSEVDEAAHRVKLAGQGDDKSGGGSARMVMESRLSATASGGSEIVVVADVDLAGKLVRFGRGMIEGISKQLFKQFAERVRAELAKEAPAAGEAASAASMVQEEAKAATGEVAAVSAEVPTASTNASALEGNASTASTNASALEGNASAVSINTSALEGNASTASTNASALEGNASAASTNASALEGNASAVSTNASALEGNASAVSTNASAVEGNASPVAEAAPTAQEGVSVVPEPVAAVPKDAAEPPNPPATALAPAPKENPPLEVGGLVFATLWSWIKGLFRRLFGRGRS